MTHRTLWMRWYLTFLFTNLGGQEVFKFIFYVICRLTPYIDASVFSSESFTVCVATIINCEDEWTSLSNCLSKFRPHMWSRIRELPLSCDACSVEWKPLAVSAQELWLFPDLPELLSVVPHLACPAAVHHREENVGLGTEFGLRGCIQR